MQIVKINDFCGLSTKVVAIYFDDTKTTLLESLTLQLGDENNFVAALYPPKIYSNYYVNAN